MEKYNQALQYELALNASVNHETVVLFPKEFNNLYLTIVEDEKEFGDKTIQEVCFVYFNGTDINKVPITFKTETKILSKS